MSDSDEPLIASLPSKTTVLAEPVDLQDDRILRTCAAVRNITVDMPDPCEILPRSKFLLVDFWDSDDQPPKHINNNEEKALLGFNPDDEQRKTLERKHKYTIHNGNDNPNWKFDDHFGAEARYAKRARARISSSEQSKLLFPRVFYRIQPTITRNNIWDDDAFKQLRPDPPFMLNGRCLWRMEDHGDYPSYVWQNPQFEPTLDAPKKYLDNMYKYWRHAFKPMGEWLVAMNVKVGDFENETSYLAIRDRNNKLKPPPLPTWSEVSQLSDDRPHTLKNVADNPHMYPQFERFWKRIYDFNKPRKREKPWFGAPNVIKSPMLLTQVPMTNIVLPMSTMGEIFLKRAEQIVDAVPLEEITFNLKLQPTWKYQVHDLVLSDEPSPYGVKFSGLLTDADRANPDLTLMIFVRDVPFEAKTKWSVNARYREKNWYSFDIQVANRSLIREYNYKIKVDAQNKTSTFVKLTGKLRRTYVNKDLDDALIKLLPDKVWINKQRLANEQATEAKENNPGWEEPYQTRVLDSIEIELARETATFNKEPINSAKTYISAYKALVKAKRNERLPPSNGYIDKAEKGKFSFPYEDSETVEEWRKTDEPLMSWDTKVLLIKGTEKYPKVITDNARKLRSRNTLNDKRKQFEEEEEKLDEQIANLWGRANESIFTGDSGFALSTPDKFQDFRISFNKWADAQTIPVIPILYPRFSFVTNDEDEDSPTLPYVQRNLHHAVGNGFRHLAYLLYLRSSGELPSEQIQQQEIDCRITRIYNMNFLTTKGLLNAIRDIRQDENDPNKWRDECNFDETRKMWSINNDMARIKKPEDKSFLYKQHSIYTHRQELSDIFKKMKESGSPVDEKLLKGIIVDTAKLRFTRDNDMRSYIMKRYNQATLDQQMLDNLVKQVPASKRKSVYKSVIWQMLDERTESDASFVRNIFNRVVSKKGINLKFNIQEPGQAHPRQAQPAPLTPLLAPLAPLAHLAEHLPPQVLVAQPAKQTQPAQPAHPALPAPPKAPKLDNLARETANCHQVIAYFNRHAFAPKGLFRTDMLWTEVPLVEGLWDWEPVGCRLLSDLDDQRVLVFYQRGPKERREDSTVIWFFGKEYETTLKYEYAESCGFGVPIIQFLTIESNTNIPDDSNPLYWTGIHTPFKIEDPPDDSSVGSLIELMQSHNFVHGSLFKTNITMYNGSLVAFGFVTSYIFDMIPKDFQSLDFNTYNQIPISRNVKYDYETLFFGSVQSSNDDEDDLWTFESIKHNLGQSSLEMNEFIDICNRYNGRSSWTNYRAQLANGLLSQDDLAVVLLTMFPKMTRGRGAEFITATKLRGSSAKEQLSILFDGYQPTVFLNCNTSSCSTLLNINGNIVKRVRINTKQPWFKLTLHHEFAMMDVAYGIRVGVKPISCNRVKHTPQMLAVLFQVYKDDIDATFWDLTMDAYDQTFENVMKCEQPDEQIHGFAERIHQLLTIMRNHGFTHGQFIPRHLVLKYNPNGVELSLIDFSRSSNTFNEVTSLDEQRFMHTINLESTASNLTGRNYTVLLEQLQRLSRVIPNDITIDQNKYDKRMGVEVMNQFRTWQHITVNDDTVRGLGAEGLKSNFNDWMFFTKWQAAYFETKKKLDITS